MSKEEVVSKEEIALVIIEAGAVEIRDVPPMVKNIDKLPKKRQPFLYASGNWGPGYISVKGTVGQKKTIKFLSKNLASKVVDKTHKIDFIAGNVTGGMIPGWLISEELESLLGKTVPFVYIRGTRKKGGQKELITGITNNPEITEGNNGLIVEELVNFAQTTCNGAVAIRSAGYKVIHAATILFYDNPEAIKALKEHKIEIIYLITLPEVLKVLEEHSIYPQKVIDDYRQFLANPLGWQIERGLKPVKEGGTR
ncbi:MAG: orotate phosphoribosyltransferase [Candidatus Nealsonbacteria bacterium]